MQSLYFSFKKNKEERVNNSEIVSKLWNLCNVLRDDGITYHQYVTDVICCEL